MKNIHKTAKTHFINETISLVIKAQIHKEIVVKFCAFMARIKKFPKQLILEISMKANLGLIDKVVRVAIAVLVTVLFFTEIISGIMVFISLIVAVVLLITSSMSYCPVYGVCGINTKKKLNDKVHNSGNKNYFNK